MSLCEANERRDARAPYGELRSTLRLLGTGSCNTPMIPEVAEIAARAIERTRHPFDNCAAEFGDSANDSLRLKAGASLVPRMKQNTTHVTKPSRAL